MGVRIKWGPVRFVMSLGWIGAAVVAGGCGVRAGAGEALPSIAAFEGREIEEVRFADPGPFSADTLAAVVETQATRCSFLGLPICLPFGNVGREEGRVDTETIFQDVLRLEAFYRSSGYFGTDVVPVVEPEADDEAVVVTFVISPGDPVYLDTLVVTGTEPLMEPDSLANELRLRPGDLFDLGDFAASADTIRARFLAEGYAFVEVLRSYDVDTIADRARARLDVVPGPQVVVDSIIVRGANRIGRRTAIRQLTFREGDLLRATELVASQRNLYGLEIVQFAAVTIAPDSLQVDPSDRSRTTVLVQVVEGPVHVVEAAVGYGTVDCFRARVQWVSRSFGGDARRLALTAMLSKIGIGDPLDAGFAGSICGAFEDDPFSDLLDYHFSVELTQPYFLGPRNNVALNLFATRRSEPNVYQRESEGARLVVARQISPRELLTTSIEFEQRQVIASPAIFCIAFLVCTPEDIEGLTQHQFTTTLGASWFRNRTDLLVDPTRGYVARVALDRATPWFGSEVDYTRGAAEASVYTPIRRRSVLAAHVRLGSFLNSASIGEPGGDFISPEDRFYAGGANSVRGFNRNELGPGVYVEEGPQFDEGAVEFIPIGGLSVIETSLELRFPSPWFGNNVRLATFVDAGAVSEERIWEIDGNDWRITPGVGVRIGTPIGPVRVDVAYNPYSRRTAPLYLIEPETGVLVRVADDFAPDRGGFFQRLRFHLAVGQPF